MLCSTKPDNDKHMGEQQQKGFWQRIRHKYRIAVLDEGTLNERWHIRLSGLGTLSVLFLLFLLTLAVFSLLIVYTPIRTVLPGYSEDIRRQLIVESARVDSIETSLVVQRQYLDVIKQITAGEVQSDTVQHIDSVQIVAREKILQEAKNDALAEFMAQYEEKEKDNLSLFDIQQNQPIISLFRPVRGAVLTHSQPEHGQYAVLLRTIDHENVCSVLSGTLIYASHELDNTHTVVVQHQDYVSIYRGVESVLKQIGSAVQSGETIALMGTEGTLSFELWRNGQSINPEEVIAF